ncbi:MAG: rhodanese-like domain-containing protein [Bacteroidales bacterium]|jgi:rhodanese-related sulfurtransferase|nr:rhodanese-like domain-containing protein [Bacteroidales bacterium]
MITTNKPTIQDFQIEGVKHITPLNAFELLQKEKAILIDVREIDEVEFERVNMDNVLYYPMSTIPDKLKYIAKDQNIILICPAGLRSTKVVNLLNIQDYPNVANLDGGFTSWRKHNLPFESKSINTGGCCGGGGCGTSSSSEGSSCC